MTDEIAFEASIINISLAERLKVLRSKKRMSQHALGVKIGRNGDAISKLETGQRKFSIHTLWALCIAMNCEPDEFFSALPRPEVLTLDTDD